MLEQVSMTFQMVSLTVPGGGGGVEYCVGKANVGWMVGNVEYCEAGGQQDEGVGDPDYGVSASDFCCGESSPVWLLRGLAN